MTITCSSFSMIEIAGRALDSLISTALPSARGMPKNGISRKMIARQVREARALHRAAIHARDITLTRTAVITAHDGEVWSGPDLCPLVN